MEDIFNYFGKNSQFFLDTGCALAWAMQTFNPCDEQRIYHDFNNTAMGWALPASIGGYLADNTKKTICISGDGSIMMNLQELATIKHKQYPIVIIVINNDGYSMIKQTQDQWLNSKYLASSPIGGVGFPSFDKLGEGFGIESHTISKVSDIKKMKEKLSIDLRKPIIFNIMIDQDWRVTPQVKFGKPNEDPEPLIDRKIFKENMIVKPLDID
tara:strand:- start:62 stop:697 length:636 start_codon:yes stop_codon:yes gene_type:complete